MSVEIIRMCWLFLRVICKALAESVFIYLFFDINVNQLYRSRCGSFLNKNKMFLFSFVYSLTAAMLITFLNASDFYRIISVVLTFIYFQYSQRKIYKNLISSGSNARSIKLTLTTAIILILSVESSDSISHMLIHTYCTSAGIYNMINSSWILRDLYKSSIMLLDVLFIFLVHKFQFIKMKDIKAMLVNKWVPILFGLCLISNIYIRYNYAMFSNIPSIAPYREILLWTLAFMLPTYWGFYLIIKQLTKVLNLIANVSLDESILTWIFNPSIIETTHLDIYDSDVFMANFEAKKFALKAKLNKLGINNRCKGYSELVLCLFLTRLFIGFKNWSFEREILGQASLVIDVPLSDLRKNIETIIDQVWLTSEAETLIAGYYLPYRSSHTYDQTQRPTVEQFLTDVAKSI